MHLKAQVATRILKEYTVYASAGLSEARGLYWVNVHFSQPFSTRMKSGSPAIPEGLRKLGKSRQAHQRTAGSPANAKLTFRYPSSLINHSTLLLHGRLTSERQAHQRTQSLPSATHRHSSITRLCCSSAQAPSFLYSSTRSRRAVEVIICMITRDFSVISIDVTGVSLSLSLSLSLLLTKVTHAQYRKRFRVSYNKQCFLK